MRPVVVHYHIFKNAGMSVDRLLSENFGSGWATFEGLHATDIVSSERLGDFIQQNTAVVAVSSHLSRPPLPGGVDAVPIVFIRHPLDRVESVYEFVRRDPSQPQHDLLKKLTLTEYVAWVLDNGWGGVVIRDYQTIHLSKASFRHSHIYEAQATLEDLHEAMEFLNSIPVVGVVDHFGPSIYAYQTLITERVRPVKFGELKENVSESRTGTLEERLEKLRSALQESLWNRLVEANSLDLALYEYAHRRLLSILRPAEEVVETQRTAEYA